MNGSFSILRLDVRDGVGSIVLTRAEENNTITPTPARRARRAAITQHDDDREVRVILLRAESPAFCAGYGLDWSTERRPPRGSSSTGAPGSR